MPAGSRAISSDTIVEMLEKYKVHIYAHLLRFAATHLIPSIQFMPFCDKVRRIRPMTSSPAL
jgi:hypothetical protein